MPLFSPFLSRRQVFVTFCLRDLISEQRQSEVSYLLKCYFSNQKMTKNGFLKNAIKTPTLKIMEKKSSNAIWQNGAAYSKVAMSAVATECPRLICYVYRGQEGWLRLLDPGEIVRLPCPSRLVSRQHLRFH